MKALSPKDDDAGMPLLNTSEREGGREGQKVREVEGKLGERQRKVKR